MTAGASIGSAPNDGKRITLQAIQMQKYVKVFNIQNIFLAAGHFSVAIFPASGRQKERFLAFYREVHPACKEREDGIFFIKNPSMLPFRDNLKFTPPLI
jgi:hypothetical protein